MKKRLLDLLQCPYDGTSPLDMRIGKAEEAKDSLAIDRVFCEHYCANKDGSVQNCMPVVWDCQECLRSEIIEALLICPSCHRWFPVIEGIPSIMPDELRSDREEEFLKAFPSIPQSGRFRVGPFRKSEFDIEVINKRQEMQRRDCESPVYELVFTQYTNNRERDAVFARLAFSKEDILLDIGCGTGRLTREYAIRVRESIAADFSFESLRILQDDIKSKFLAPIHPIQLDACLLPFRDYSFHKVLSTQVYEHIPSKQLRLKAYREANRVMNAEGALVLTVYLYNLHKRLYHYFKPGKFEDTGKSGYHSNGQIYYYNFSFGEAYRELSSIFKIDEITGIINNIPLITRFLRGQREKVDCFLEKTRLSHILGTFILGKCLKKDPSMCL